MFQPYMFVIRLTRREENRYSGAFRIEILELYLYIV